ncbi:MAG: RNA polymerase sigma-70 factor [Bacteroidales bacterium]|jgi:RNA polymerase sigma-70 factor (ECF subfamily)|nr:RNA polymerase sigma-70 factor [Bacteroidales bacterium]
MNNSNSIIRLQQKSKQEETELLIRLRKGERQAFTALFYLYRDKLLSYLLCITGSIEDSEDILQDVFLIIWLERENIGIIENINAYIFKIAKNKVIDNFRKLSKKESFMPDIIIDMVEETPEDILLDKEKHLILQEAVNQLSPQQKKVYQLHREQGKRLKDIAEEMNLSLFTVQNHMSQALKNISKYFMKKKYL